MQPSPLRSPASSLHAAAAPPRPSHHHLLLLRPGGLGRRRQPRPAAALQGDKTEGRPAAAVDLLDPAPFTPSPSTLADAASVFAAHPTPRLVVALLLTGTAARVALAPFTPLDLLALALGASGWVLAEPALHALLHAPGWAGARIHESHHTVSSYFHVSIDPPELVLGWIGVVAVITAGAVCVFSAPPGPALTGLLSYCLAGLSYEAVHYGAHCRYTPANGYLRALKTHHQLHHLHAETHWLAFQAPFLDKWAGRAPGRVGEVEKGPMAKAAQAARKRG